MLFLITTSGFEPTTICWELHDYARKILDGTLDDDAWFAYIATADAGDDWADPRTWAKANPALGLSVKLGDLERKARRALATPAAQNTFKRMHLCIWTEGAERWVPIILTR